MIEGAIIGVIVAIVMIIIKKNQEKKALAKVINDDVIDQPDYAAFFHVASQKTFESKGLKFFDSNGVATINGAQLHYKPQQKGKAEINIDLGAATISAAPEKRKMTWVEIDSNGEKHYFTSFSQGAFKVDTSEMSKFIDKLKEINSGF